MSIHSVAYEGSKDDDLTEKISSLELGRKVEQEDKKSGSYAEHQPLNHEDLSGQDWDWDDIQTTSSANGCKQKHNTQRMKIKEYNIIANQKDVARSPSYYKFDRSTTNILQMLIDQQLSGDFHNVVSKGTNSVVIHAHCYGQYQIYFPCGNALKVYKLSNSVENNNAIYKRVQRENEHLLILRNQHFSNNTPHPVYLDKNVILMSFIGADQESAPSISILPLDKINGIYQEMIQEIDTWYKKLGLVHGNLSASNILFWMDKLYVVGWSHSVKRENPMALKKLMKDCQFITEFFQSRGTPVKRVEELFKNITGLEKISSKVLEVVDKDLWKDPRVSNPNRSAVPETKSTRNRFK